MIKLKVLDHLIFKICIGKLPFKNNVIAKKFWDFQHFVTFQISVSYLCLYWYCSPSLDSESNSESEKQSRLYLEFNLCIYASHCCLVLFRLKASGLLVWGLSTFGDGFCCCLLSSSFFWDLQKGQSGPQPTFFCFWAGGLLFCLRFFLQRRPYTSYISVLFLFSVTK